MEPSVPPSTKKNQPESLGEEVLHDIEDFFAPNATGMVARHRRQRAERLAYEAEQVNTAERVEQPAFRAVKTAPESPEVFSATSFTIQPGANLAVLPLSPYRYRAVIIVVTTASTVILAKDSGNAIAAQGFTLPAGVPLPLHTRAQVYAYNPGASAVTVSVISEIYAPES